MIEVEDLMRRFPAPSRFLAPKRWVHAVNGVTLRIEAGGVLAIVGESGCGKSTLGRMMAGLIPVTGGHIRLDGMDLGTRPDAERQRALRTVQLVHQDPYAALNPTRTIGQTLLSPVFAHGFVPRREAHSYVSGILERVGIRPGDVLDRYPHQLSGGQRQRALIARALVMKPRFLVADEAVSMIDVSLRIGVLDLLRSLRTDLGIGIVFITHDFGVARYIARDGEMAIMYLGRVVEHGRTDDIIYRPAHAYTQMLISAVPVHDPRYRQRARILPKSYDVPSSVDLPSGCSFEPRCPFAVERCRTGRPLLVIEPDVGHPVACHLAEVRGVSPEGAVGQE